MTRKTRPYRDALLEALSDPLEAAEYLSVAREDSPEMFRKACLNVIQARRRVSQVARQVGVSRESLYRSFSAEGNPSQGTVDAVLDALQLEYIGIRPKGEHPHSANPTPTMVATLGIRRKRSRVRSMPDRQLSFDYEQVIPQAMASVEPARTSALFTNTLNAWAGTWEKGAFGQVEGTGAYLKALFSDTGRGIGAVAPIPAFICAASNNEGEAVEVEALAG